MKKFSDFSVARLAAIRACFPVLLLLILPATVRGQFIFETNNGAITITGYTGSNTVVTIPDFTNGYPVTSIGDGAFNFNHKVTSVEVGNNVTNVGDNAFLYCTALKNVTLGSGVSSIGDNAFSNCSALTNVTLGSSVSSIGATVFIYCSRLTAITVDAQNQFYSSVNGVLLNKSQTILVAYPTGLSGTYTVPSSVTSIGDSALAYSGITSVIIRNGVTNVGSRAFYECVALTNVTFPTTLITIGTWAFEDCNLAAVNLPDALTTIESWAFVGNPLSNILIPSGVTYLAPGAFSDTYVTNFVVDPLNVAYSSVGGVLFNKQQTRLVSYPCRREGSYSVPPTITTIGDWAFAGGFNPARVRSVTIPDGVTSIEDWAFSWCNYMTNVTIPNTVTNIGYRAFHFCVSLPAVNIPTGLTSIAPFAFDNCGFTNVVIPNGVTSIGAKAFWGCIGLRYLQLPDSVTNIDDNAFEDCGLSAVYFQGMPPGIGSGVFGSGTMYYLAGMPGWGPAFGGRPTALWVLPYPLILSSSLSLGDNGLGFRISWATNVSVTVEACTDLAQPTWSSIGTNPLVNGWSDFSDAAWTNYPSRFYRIRSP